MKTYILAGLLMILGVLMAFNLINKEIAEAIFALLTGGAFVALRAGVKSEVAKSTEPKE